MYPGVDECREDEEDSDRSDEEDGAAALPVEDFSVSKQGKHVDVEF